jgi:polyferredoxin
MQSALRSRWPQLVLQVMLLVLFGFSIVAGSVGTAVGSHNFAVVFVWIAWWAALILIAVPFLGRGWCAVCPIGAPGDWLQRGSVLSPGSRHGLVSRLPRWPKPLRSMWLQNASFALLALFSVVILTTPSVTAAVLAIMLFGAIGLSLFFERRAFCRYLCPVGGFIGLYSQTAPLELRVRDGRACAACNSKACYNGSQEGSGCPWGVYPRALTKNTYCGMCLECLRTCPNDNIAISLRPFAADLAAPSTRLDEAFKAFVMLGSALVYTFVMMGSNGTVKLAAYSVLTPPWLAYAAGFLVIMFVVLPGLFLLVTSAGQRAKAWDEQRRRFTAAAAALIPLGLTFWVAFSVGFLLTNASYILAAASDPLGLGWNVFGTAGIAWQPILGGWVAPLQTIILAVGLLWAARTAQRVASKGAFKPGPVLVYCLAVTLLMLWLLL